MNLKERIDLLVRLHLLIQRKATGTPERLAQKLDISLPTTFRYLDILKAYDAPIAYCKHRGAYYYTEDFELKFY